MPGISLSLAPQTVSPQFSQLFTFDVNDPDQAALVLKVKHDKPFSPTNREHQPPVIASCKATGVVARYQALSTGGVPCK
jgi:hypothetical protein